jgi:nitric oxide dioxygenase
MKLEAIALVSDSIKDVMLNSDRAIALFHGRLLTLNPALCTLFPSDFQPHGRRFLEMIKLVVSGLQAPETIMPLVRESGQIHIRRGVQPHHYHTFGEAFFWTLSELHGEGYTDELAQAWAEFYYLLAGLMKESAIPPSNTTSLELPL